jgi:CheY-like chemotaxis protein
VRNLIELHRGTVSAHSEGRGHGSEFVVRLPKAKAPARKRGGRPRRPALSPTTGAAHDSWRILVVDDNEDGAEMLAEALRAKGYRTRVAHDAPTALRVAAEFRPSLAFLDIGLPVMDGYELASRLREVTGLADIRLIALTGYGQESDRQKTRAAGFQHHLVKPVDFQAIETVLSAAPDEPSHEPS